MGCKCKVARNLEYIQNTYGADKTRKTTNIKGMFPKYVLNAILWLFMIPVIPILFCINIFKSITHNTIKISNLVRPFAHVRN